MTDAGLAHLAKLERLQTVGLASTKIGNAGLARLASRTALQEIDLSGTHVDDAGLVHLVKLTGLRALGLARTRVGNAGVARLVAHRGLQKLDLSGTRVTDACLARLAKLKQLRELDLTSTRATASRIEALRKACPSPRFDIPPRSNDPGLREGTFTSPAAVCPGRQPAAKVYQLALRTRCAESPLRMARSASVL